MVPDIRLQPSQFGDGMGWGSPYRTPYSTLNSESLFISVDECTCVATWSQKIGKAMQDKRGMLFHRLSYEERYVIVSPIRKSLLRHFEWK